MICLVTGGARSGKSSYAEAQIEALPAGERIYIATLIPGSDPENHERIAKHRAQREGKGFRTLECPTGLARLDVPKQSIVLLECLTNLVANEMFSPEGAGANTREVVLAGVEELCARARDAFIVTNDIFSDGITYEPSVEEYRRVLSEIEREIARRADRVVEMVCGIPLTLKERETRET